MAGLKAAATAPTWPDINGTIVPEGIFSGFLHNIVYNKIGVHFIHRSLAYLITLLIFIWWFKAKNISNSSAFNKAKNLALFFVIAQVALGIFTVLTSPEIKVGKFNVFEWLAEMHQLTGMLLLLSMVSSVYILGRKRLTQ